MRLFTMTAVKEPTADGVATYPLDCELQLLALHPCFAGQIQRLRISGRSIVNGGLIMEYRKRAAGPAGFALLTFL